MLRLLLVALAMMINAKMALGDVLPPPKNFAGFERNSEWWTEQDSGWLGGVIGGSVGLIGAAFGVTAGLGKARSFVLALALVLCGGGFVLLTMGAIAVASGQPYHVYFPFFLIGGVLTFVMGLNYPIVKRRYDQMESQRMQAMDS